MLIGAYENVISSGKESPALSPDIVTVGEVRQSVRRGTIMLSAMREMEKNEVRDGGLDIEKGENNKTTKVPQASED